MFGSCDGLCMKRENSIMASYQPLSSLVMHGLFEVMPIRGRGQRAHQHNTKRHSGIWRERLGRGAAKKRKRGSNIVSMGNDGECDPVTHNAFRVEAGAADNHANSRARARRHTHGLLPRSRKALHRGAGPLAERVIER